MSRCFVLKVCVKITLLSLSDYVGLFVGIPAQNTQ